MRFVGLTLAACRCAEGVEASAGQGDDEHDLMLGEPVEIVGDEHDDDDDQHDSQMVTQNITDDDDDDDHTHGCECDEDAGDTENDEQEEADDDEIEIENDDDDDDEDDDDDDDEEGSDMEGDDDTLEENLLNELTTNDDLYVELEDMLAPDLVFDSHHHHQHALNPLSSALQGFRRLARPENMGFSDSNDGTCVTH